MSITCQLSGSIQPLQIQLFYQRNLIRIFAILLFTIPFSTALAIAQKAVSEPKIPTTLAEAHAELERTLPVKELKKIDAMESEDKMNEYHRGLGKDIRNGWGLWTGSSLSEHMRGLGFNHPDDMSGVILATFWCKRHGQPFRLKERSAEYAAYWQETRNANENESKRVESVKRKMKSMMIGLKLNTQRTTTVKMPDRIDSSIRARFLARYNDGVLLSVREKKGMRDDEFVTKPYFFSSKDRLIHKIRIPELKDIGSVVCAGQTVWVCGISNGKNCVIGLSTKQRIQIDLPEGGTIPQLGFHGDSLLAVYSRSVYELANCQWKELYKGEIIIPKSGPPPQLIESHLYLRDEGIGENEKRFWWLVIGPNPKIVSLDKDVEVVGSDGPRWENSFSYTVTKSGEIWACVGESNDRKSLLRKSKDGTYLIAIMNNSVKFTPEIFGSEKTDQGISVSAVTLLHDGTILLVGDSGLYRLIGNELNRELTFTNTRQKIPINHGKNVSHWDWNPSNVLVLGNDSYFISGAFGGIYMLTKHGNGKWTFESLDESLGKPIVW